MPIDSHLIQKMVAVYFNCKQTSCIASKGILWRLKIKVMQFTEHSGCKYIVSSKLICIGIAF